MNDDRSINHNLFRRITSTNKSSVFGDSVISVIEQTNPSPNLINNHCNESNQPKQNNEIQQDQNWGVSTIRKEQKEQKKVEQQDISDSIVPIIRRRQQEMEREIIFNIIIVGESSLGKSSFIDAIQRKFKEGIRQSTDDFEMTQYRIDSINFSMNLIDSKGYNYESDHSKWLNNIIMNICDRFRDYKRQKQQTKSHNEIIDNRVHLCLYFLSGPRIKEMDILNMKELQQFVNMIPILAKGDTYTQSEVKQIKNMILTQCKQTGVNIFDIQKCVSKKSINQVQKQRILDQMTNGVFGQSPPFLFISSFQKIIINNQEIIG